MPYDPLMRWENEGGAILPDPLDPRLRAVWSEGLTSPRRAQLVALFGVEERRAGCADAPTPR
jgi:hypothetical protein